MSLRCLRLCLIGVVPLFIGLRADAGVSLENCVVPVAGARAESPAERTVGRVVRTALTQQELAVPMRFGLMLKMSRLDELRERVARGEVLSRAQLEDYLPSKEDYNEVRAWLEEQGFKITLEADTRHAIFAEGACSRLATSFGVTFARVASADGEFTSAISAPQLPEVVAKKVSAIRGLQPHLIRHPHTPRFSQGLTVPGYYSITPAAVTTAYNTPSQLTGSGQTIAIIGDAIPTDSDLTTFWNQCGIPQVLSNVTVVRVSGGPTNSATGNKCEVAMDVEWSSGVAPGAKIRVYATPFPLNSAGESAALTQLLNDVAKDSSLRQVSESYGGSEDASVGQGDSTLLLLAAQGVSFFASSGDAGSNPLETNQTAYFSSSTGLAVSYPASDPSVVAVGGTTLAFPNSSAGTVQLPETTWSLDTGNYAAGGGVSLYINRPSWQVARGLPSGSRRCVPDVSAMADYGDPSVNRAPYTYVEGHALVGGGTSLSSPIWAGLNALLNQARANAGLSSAGLITPKLYAAANTAAFNDITLGSIGAYSAHVGYDLCTGLGSPDMTNLSAYFAQTPQAATLSSQPTNVVVCANQPASFSVKAFGYPLPTFQWQRMAVATNTWVNLSDDGVYGGTTSFQLDIASPTQAMSGDYFRCQVSNSGASQTSSLALLTVTAAAKPSLSVPSNTLALAAGNTLEFNPTVSGSEPISYQWSKNNSAIAGATSAHFIRSPLTESDAGTYLLTATNSLGSATCAVTVTVSPLVAPTINLKTSTVSVAAGGQLFLDPDVSGSSPMWFAWTKDGATANGENQSFLIKGSVTAADAGSYTLKATNAAGYATYVMTVTVTSPTQNTASSSSSGTGSTGGGSGGGGGAGGEFYLLALALVFSLRRFRAKS